MIPDFEMHYKKLRELYLRATTKQRILVAIDRMRYPDAGPNLLITAVSAVEALARAMALEVERRSGRPLRAAYRRLRNLGPVELLEKVVARAHGVRVSDLIGPGTWEEFQWAVKYRNLLLHEGTYLAQLYSRPLLRSTHALFDKLVRLSEIRDKPTLDQEPRS